MFGCRHTWREVQRTYTGTGPEHGLRNFNLEGVDPRRHHRVMTFGVTVVELRCDRCGDVTSRELLGDCRAQPTPTSKEEPA